MNGVRLSALVVAHNEEKRLGACLDALAFCDEIVVVLDRCTDRSADCARTRGARIIEGSWPIEADRRAAGQDAATGDWIFEVDADETVSPALAAEVREVVASSRSDWHRIPFDNYIGGRLVRYGWGAHFGVSAKAILFRRGVKSWGRERVHPKVRMTGSSGPSLQTPMRHDVDENIADMIQRLDRYTTAHAQDLADAGHLGTLRKNVLRLFGRFWKCFVRRKGYREGGLGLLIALCAGLYPLLSYLKAYYDFLNPPAVK